MRVATESLPLQHAVAQQAAEAEIEFLVEFARVVLVQRETLGRHFLALLHLEEGRHAGNEAVVFGDHGEIFARELVVAVIPRTERFERGIVDLRVDPAALLDDHVVGLRVLGQDRQTNEQEQPQAADQCA